MVLGLLQFTDVSFSSREVEGPHGGAGGFLILLAFVGPALLGIGGGGGAFGLGGAGGGGGNCDCDGGVGVVFPGGSGNFPPFGICRIAFSVILFLLEQVLKSLLPLNVLDA